MNRQNPESGFNINPHRFVALATYSHSETSGIELRNCPAYIREWVSRERAQRSAELSDLEAGAKEDIQDV
jgi:hypothetical protein